MKITISFKNLEHTNALDSRIRSKTEKLKKYLNGNISVKWTCSINEGFHYADIDLTGPTFSFHAKARSENLYKTLDLAVAKIEKQLSKQKSKWKDHIHHSQKAEFINPYEKEGEIAA